MTPEDLLRLGQAMSAPEDLRIIRPKELAELLDVSAMTLWRWGRDGSIPKKIKIGPNVRGYRRAEIERWLAQRAGGR